MAVSKFGSNGSKSKMTMKVGSASAGPSSKSKGKGKMRSEDVSSDEQGDEDFSEDDVSLEMEDDGDDEVDEEPDTEDEIEAAKGIGAKSKKTAKRKRRATSPTSFGNALEDLLGLAPAALDEEEEDAEGVEAGAKEDKPKKKRKSTKPVSEVPAILSLAPHLRRSAQSTTLSARAARIALEQRRRREERCHVKDVIGGWGPPGVLPPLEDEDGNIIESTTRDADEEQKLQEWAAQGGGQGYERKLRKVAQRGVVKLFNAIRAAQTTTEEDLEESEAKKSKAAPATAKRTSAASSITKKPAGLVGKEARLADLSKSNFLDLIKKGSGKSGVAAK